MFGFELPRGMFQGIAHSGIWMRNVLFDTRKIKVFNMIVSCGLASELCTYILNYDLVLKIE